MDKELKNKTDKPKMVTIRKEDPEYPEPLKTIDQPPVSLYTIGDASLLKTPCVAVVGTRKASPYGGWCAYELGKTAALYGITVVSGMAMGIDAKAHWGALDVGGKTIAVLGSGADVCYPPSNRKLYETICAKGLVVSELAPGFQPLRTTFPGRNRIISGLSAGTVVVEAAIKSGSLITAEHAIKQGRPVLAVPGNLNQVFSYGCNKLIRDGALILTAFDDITELFFFESPKTGMRKPSVPRMTKDEERIYRILKEEGELPMDSISIKLAMNPEDVARNLTYMEIKGLVHTEMGRAFLS